MRVGSGVILFQLAGFLTSALADFYFAKHTPLIFDFVRSALRVSASFFPLCFAVGSIT